MNGSLQVKRLLSFEKEFRHECLIVPHYRNLGVSAYGPFKLFVNYILYLSLANASMQIVNLKYLIKREENTNLSAPFKLLRFSP